MSDNNKFEATFGSSGGSGGGGTSPSPANPTAEVGATAVNGTANTYMRSDSAPALEDSGVTADTYGDRTNVPQISVDAKGRVTSATNVPLPATPTSANPTAEVGATAVNGTASTFMRSDSAPALEDSGVTPDTYGDVNNVPQIRVDAKGRVFQATNVPIPATPTSANPTARVGATAVNGTASTFMTSDSAPALEDSGVTAGTYGQPKTSVTIRVDAKGRVEDIQEVTSSIISTNTNAGELPILTATGVIESSNDLTYTLQGSTNTNATIGIGLGGVANTKGALQIESFIDYSGQPSEYPFDYFIYTGTGGPFQNFAGTGAFAIGVHTTARFMGSGIHIFSDERIKKDIEVSNSKEDLETISKLEICDYKYIDIVKGGAEKKVIAQQVKKHYPLAVKEGTDIIPCFMEKAEIKDGIINLQLDCVVGDKIKLIFPNGKEELTQVLEVNQESIKVESSQNDDVFVYGKEVNDYQTIDYDALSMLNISATQELHKTIKELKSEIEELKRTCKK